MFTGWRVKPKRDDRVIPEDEQEDDGDVKKIAMQILQNKRKSCFTAITMGTRFTNCASRRIQKERAIVGFTVVIAGSAETEWCPEDQQRRRQRPPTGLDQRRIKRRKI